MSFRWHRLITWLTPPLLVASTVLLCLFPPLYDSAIELYYASRGRLSSTRLSAPFVNQVIFTGNHLVSEELLRRTAQVKRGDALSPTDLDESKERLQHLY